MWVQWIKKSPFYNSVISKVHYVLPNSRQYPRRNGYYTTTLCNLYIEFLGEPGEYSQVQIQPTMEYSRMCKICSMIAGG